MERDVFGQRQRAARPPSRVLSHASRVYVMPQMLGAEEVQAVELEAAGLGAVVCDVRDDANILLTGMRAPRRIERHTSEIERVRTTAHKTSKPIVNVAWLEACANEGVCVDMAKFVVMEMTIETTEATKKEQEGPPSKAQRGPSPTDSDTETDTSHDSLEESSTEDSPASRFTLPQADLPTKDGVADPPDEATDAEAWRNAPAWQNTESALYRPTPLQSIHNQPLVDELQLLRRHRRLTTDMYSEMAYMRAAAAVKALPYALASVPYETLSTIKGIGSKMATVIRQFYQLGKIAEADTIRADAAVQTMLSFTTLYSIGPRTAERAYNEGCRTLEDLTRHKSTELSTHLGVAESLALLPDLEQRIPRAEVEDIASKVRTVAHQIMHELRTILPHAVGAIAGSYRRGAASSGDVDLVVTHGPTDTMSPGTALRMLVEHLRASGHVTHTVSVARRAHTDKQLEEHGVDVAQLVYRCTPTSVHRRVDIVFAPRAQYGAALLGWTGSVLYERDLRRAARAKGYVVRRSSHQFAATGLTRIDDPAPLDTPTEQSIFSMLDIPRIPPRLRNAD
ncbi:DNA-directed DNA polymerase [Malassezia japonica]|uniref:DNA polymerase n=1 Tax=Malassezia japonica TaxID=223818 RepID=A0AAF0J902_9BASI|nr:DNA-directed DNA polymerase [Malassezia japonica]WFD37439.1 DNA-directed DNA polymerase [Malassezia japonica]